MLRHSPAERFLKYLILHPSNYTNDKIHELCLRSQLDSLSSMYLDELRGDMVLPSPFFPFDKTHKASYLFILRNDVDELFHQDAVTKQAASFLSQPRAKEFIEAMSLCGAPPKAIAFRMMKRKIKATEKSVTKYLKFFWDLTKVDSSDVRALLQVRSSLLENSADPALQAQYKAYKSSAWSDPRKIAAEMPESPHAALVAQMRMGIMPTNVEMSTLLGTMFTLATAKAIETLAVPGKYSAKNFSDLVNGLRVVKELQDSMENPNDKLQKDLQSLALKTTIEKVPSIGQLSSGNYTHTVVPDKELYSTNMEALEKEEEDDGNGGDIPDFGT